MSVSFDHQDYEPSHPPPPALVSLLPPLAPTGSSTITTASANPKQRADLLSLKSRLAAVLPPEAGLEYWEALVHFMSGKINRQELGAVMRRTLGTQGEAVQLHNAIVLSVLYNTTRNAVPPAAVRHAGWHKRPRDKDGLTLEDRDPKRRKLKAAVMAIGKRERAELKTLGLSAGGTSSLAKKEVEGRAETGKLLQASLGTREDSNGGFASELTASTGKPSSSPTSLRDDYVRCLQAPLCCESKLLPDVDTLQDRMSLIAYQNGLGAAADARVAELGIQALESHLLGMISGVLSLVRSDQSDVSNKRTNEGQESMPAGATSVSERPPSTAHVDPLPLLAAPSTSRPSPVPLSVKDFSSLFDMSPFLLVQPHLAVIERMAAIAPPSSDDEEEEHDDNDESVGSDTNREESEHRVPDVDHRRTATIASNGKIGRKTSLRALPRSGKSRAGSLRSLSNSAGGGAPHLSNFTSGSALGGGREQYLIDPSAVAIPFGHPDVVHHPSSGAVPTLSSFSGSAPPNTGLAADDTSGLATRGGVGGAASTGASVGGTLLAQRASHGTGMPINDSQNSPKASLRNQLFPELEGPGVTTEHPHVVESPKPLQAGSPSVDTTTDAASDSDDAASKVRGKTGAPKQSGRKLWEVVDSVRLLDGVLE